MSVRSPGNKPKKPKTQLELEIINSLALKHFEKEIKTVRAEMRAVIKAVEILGDRVSALSVEIAKLSADRQA